MDSRLKAIASQDAAWTEIAETEEQLKAILERGFQDESDMVLMKETITLVLAEITWRKAELAKLQSDNECELVVEGEYKISFMDTDQDMSTWFNGSAVFVSLDPDDYGSGEPHVHFRMDDGDVISFPLSSVGERLK